VKTPDAIAAILREEGVLLPRRRADNSIAWVKATGATVRMILRNSYYAGYAIIGKNTKQMGPDGKIHTYRTPRDQQEWVPTGGATYVSLEEYDSVQTQIAERAAPRVNSWANGNALATPLLHHAPCDGRRMQAQYRTDKTHGRMAHSYVCIHPGPSGCIFVGGLAIDRRIEQIVFQEVRCPSAGSLRRAFEAENERRRDSNRGLAAQLQAAQQFQEKMQANYEGAKEPATRSLYDQKLAAAIQGVEAARQRLAAARTPRLLDLSPRYLADIAKHFRDFERIWRERLCPRERRAIARLLIRRIDLLNDRESCRGGDDLALRVTLWSGRTIDLTVPRHTGRRKRVEALASAGHSNAQIAALLNAEGMLDQHGNPMTRHSVASLLKNHTIRKTMAEKADVALKQLWEQALTPAEIAEQLTAEGLWKIGGKPWTPLSVLSHAKRLKLPKRHVVHLELVRGPVEALRAQGLSAAEAAQVLEASGLKTFDRIPWNAVIVTHIHRVLQRQGRSRFPKGFSRRRPNGNRR
jgi:hypothetical protein